MPVDKVGITSLVHGNFHKFTSGMVKLQDYKINNFDVVVYMDIFMDLLVIYHIVRLY